MEEVTPKHVYLSRRSFLRAGVVAGSVAATGALYRGLLAPPRKVRPSTPLPPEHLAAAPAPAAAPAEKRNSFEEITNYNNFYEFSTDKYEVAERAAGFVTRPWTVTI